MFRGRSQSVSYCASWRRVRLWPSIRPGTSPNTHTPHGGFRTESLAARRMQLHKLRMDICGSERKPVCCASMACDSFRGLLEMEGGLSHWDNQHLTSYLITPEFINSIIEDRNGTIWFTRSRGSDTDGGL